MKSLKTLLCLSAILVLFNSCAQQYSYKVYYGVAAKVSILKPCDPKKMKIAIMPTTYSLFHDWKNSSIIEEYWRSVLGDNIVNMIWVQNKIQELQMNPASITMNDYSVLQRELKCDAILLSQYTEDYRGAVDELFYLIDAQTQSTFLTARAWGQDKDRAVRENIWGIWRNVYNQWPQQDN